MLRILKKENRGYLQFKAGLAVQPKSLVKAALSLLVLGSLIACSDSSSLDNIDEPPLIEPVTHPLIRENRLVEYNPLSNITSTVLDFDLSTSPVIFIDNDSVSQEQDALERNVNFHNPLPDFMAFVELNQLFLFQMDTRYLHRIYEFDDDDNPNGREQVCNLRVNTVFDVSTLGNDAPTLKEQFSVYVEAAPIAGDCSVIADLRHYEIEILDSEDQSDAGRYQVRQLVEDPDESLGPNQTQLNTFAVFVGQKRTIDEFEMYSSLPIFQSANDVYGHFGFDRQNNNALTFFVRDAQSLNTTVLWTLDGPNFGLQSQANAEQPSASQPFSSQFRNEQPLIVNNTLMIQHGWDLIGIPLSAVFDDDFRSIRTNALENPILSRLDTTDTFFPLEFQLTTLDASIFTLDRSSLYQINPSSLTSERINLVDSDLDFYELSIVDNQALITKRFNDQSSSTVTFGTGNVENTLQAVTDEELQVFPNEISDNTFFNQFDETLETWTSVLFTRTDNIPDPGFNIAVGQHIDEQVYFDHDEGFTEETIAYRSDNQVNPNPLRTLTQPRLFQIALSIRDPEDELTFLSNNLRPDQDNVIYSLTDDYGLADLSVETENNTVAKQLFYFDPLNRITEASLPEVMEAIPAPSGRSVVTNCRGGREVIGTTTTCFSVN